jgi:hypothetical protein
MKRGILIILTILGMWSCSSPNGQKKEDDTSVDDSKRFSFTVLDELGDTIAKDFSFRIKLPLDTTFMGSVPHVISYAQFEEIDSLIVQEDMVSLRQYYQIRCAGDYVRLKRRIEMRGPQDYKANYVQDVDWTEVNANQVNCKFEIWGIYGEEYFQAVTQANRQGKSLAAFHYEWTEGNQADKDFFKHANDSVFRKAYYPSQYYLTWDDAETEAFRITDEGVIGDLNGDGVADRLLRYCKHGITGVCGVTRKERGGRLEFFEVE